MLEMLSISKQFPGVKALDSVNLKADAGRILALIGINGAGKSTLMNILGGIYQPDAGKIVIDGREVEIAGPKDAENNGIAFIHQEPLFFHSLTVSENIFVSNLFGSKVPGLIDKKRAENESRKHLALLGAENINPKTKVEDIPLGERQVVEIARALSIGANIIIFDEPTSSLSLHEKMSLFEVINKLRDEGKTIIYISHFLDEVKEICDDFLVLRDGKMSGNGQVKEVTRADLIRMIIGHELNVENTDRRDRSSADVVLRVDNICSGNLLNGISFELREGEILGLWGLMGSGRTELIRAMFGLDPVDKGEVYIRPAPESSELVRAKKQNLLRYSGYVTENRHADGLYLPMSVWQNCTAANMAEYASSVFQFMNTRKEVQDAKSNIERLSIKVPHASTLAEQLSGGNQQKVIFSKWMNKRARILVLDEPTRGVDVGSKLEIHKLIRILAEQGTAIFLISSEIEEMISLSDRVIVLHDGEIVAEVTEEIDKNTLMNLTFKGEEDNEHAETI